MSDSEKDGSTAVRPLRLWPGLAVASLVLLLRFLLPLVAPDKSQLAVLAGLAGGVAIVLWWLFFSRAAWPDRLGAVAVMVAALLVTKLLVHESIAEGAMGFLFFVLAVPTMSLAFVGGALVSRRLPRGYRRAALAASIVLGCAVWTVIRTGGFSGNFDHDFHWRWTPTPEERLLAQADELERLPPAAIPSAPAAAAGTAAGATGAATPSAGPGASSAEGPAEPATAPAATGSAAQGATEPVDSATAAPANAAAPLTAPEAEAEPSTDWPGFRGARRDSIVRGVRIATDWSTSPPVELWRRPIGPGWSSFAVHGNRLYTQEQRGDDELVACYDLGTGEPVWMHRNPARFWESNAGAGPRATPTLHGGRVYTLGATGILNALDAGDGSLVWSRNAAEDTKAEHSGWGFSASPVIVGDVVVVATAGRLAGYDVATGKPRWMGPDGGGDGYSSPHRVTLGGVTQVVLLSGAGAVAVSPGDGGVLWRYPWKVGTRIVQPAVTADGDMLVSSGGEMRRLAVARGAGGWTTAERWTSNGLKPYFNDFVVHGGHAYGFDGRILSAIDLRDGARKWKGGRYGNGQLVLLPEQDLLLVLSEQGELALVRATPDQFTEIAHFPAITGKTWNHPVLAGDVLLVRNGEEMAAFRLARAQLAEAR